MAGGADLDGIAQGHVVNQVASGGDGDGISQVHSDNQVDSRGDGDGLAQRHVGSQVNSRGDANVQEEDEAAMNTDYEGMLWHPNPLCPVV